MKNTKTWVKVLLLAFCLVFVFSSLIACGTDEKLADLQNQLDELKNKTDSTATDLDTDKAAKDAAIAELKTALAAVKTTADAAATAAALEAVAADLAADEAALAAAVTELKEALATKAATEAVEAKIAAVEALVKANDKADAEKAEELEAAIAALTKTVNDNKTAINTAIETEVAKLNEAIKGSTEAATKAVEKLTATVEENKKAADEAVKNLSSDMNKKVEKIEAAIAETNKALEGKADAKALEELQKTVEEGVAAEVKALTETIATKADKTAVDAAVASATAAIEALGTKVTALETKVDTMKAAIEAEIETLKGAVSALETKVEALANAKEINDAIEALADRVTTLENAMSAEKLADAYEYATQALNGAEKINFTNEKYGEVKDFDGSLNAFDKMFNDINSNLYSEAEYASFKAAYENIKFFLNRALNVEAIYDYFMQMRGLVDSLPTLVESLEAEIVAIETGKLVTLDAKCIEKLVAIYTQIGNVNAAETDASKKIVIGEDLETRYNNIVKAQANLVEAENASIDVEKAIAGVLVDTSYNTILFGKSDASIEAATTAYKTFNEKYFANEKYVALYADAYNVADKLVANWTTYQGYLARQEQLNAAAAGKPELPAYVTNFDTAKPLWTDYNEIFTLVDSTIATWQKENNIDAANYMLIYTEYEQIAYAYAYAKHMNVVVYEGMKVAELIKNVEALCAKPETLYADRALVAEYSHHIAKVVAAIQQAPKWDAESDLNDDKMLTAELLADYAIVEERMADLLKLAERMDSLMEETDHFFGADGVATVTFADYNVIMTFQSNIDAACSLYDITKESANYDALIAEPQARADALLKAYADKTAEVAMMYVTIQNVLNNKAQLLLVDGHDMNLIESYWATVWNEYKLTNPNLPLEFDVIYDAETNTYAIVGENTENMLHVSTNLAALNNQWVEVATKYEKLAETAASEAAALTERINALASVNASLLTNYTTITELWADINTWTTTYLGKEATAADIATILTNNGEAEVKGIVGIKVLNNADETYIFLAADVFNAAKTAYATAQATYDAAAKAWPSVKADAEKAMNANNNIHTDFETPYQNLVAYITTYYGVEEAKYAEIVESFKNGEYKFYGEFMSSMNAYEALCSTADDAALAIKNAIKALSALTTDQDVVDAVVIIREMIADYETTYGCSVMTCEICGMDYVEDYMALEIADATAKANIAKATFESTFKPTDDTFFNTAEIGYIYDLFASDVKKAKTVEAVKDALLTFENKLIDWTTRWAKYNALAKDAEEFIATNKIEGTEFAEDVANALAAAAKSIKKPATNAEYNNAETVFKAALAAIKAEIDAANDDAGELV